MRRLISILLFSFVFVTFLSLDVEAQTCPDNDRIMRISAPTNAHGENWSFGTATYTQDICYKTIFGQDYTGTRAGTNAVHDCITVGSNRVLRLKFNNNSHAEIPDHTTPAYRVDICYGDLTCQSVAGNLDCPDTTQEVISLSGATNAHIENYSMNVYNSNANYKKICCSTTPSSLTAPKWSYYNGEEIPSGTKICPNSYVIMNVTTGGITSGNVEFQLRDDRSILRVQSIGGPRQGAVSNNQANVTLNLSEQGLLDALNSALQNSNGLLDLDFVASYIGATSATSYELLYDGNISSCTYSNPVAIVTAPVHRGVYFNNIQISFVSGCTSRIGPVQNNWTITQEGQTTSYTSTEPEFGLIFGGNGPGHFGDAGQVNVKLKCTDMRGQYVTAESQMLVVENAKKTFAYINKPSFDEFVYNSPPGAGMPYFPERVDFSASDSFAVEVTPGTTCPTVSCLGGSCRTNTENSPSGCGAGGSITITSAPTSSNPASYINMFFNWTFWDDNWNEPWAMFEGLNNKSGALNYDDMSNNLNDKHMSVLVNYSVAGVSASASFQRDFTLGRCLNNGYKYYESISQWKSTTEANNACKGGDEAGNENDCCPTGYRCMAGITSTTPYSCQIPPGPIIIECNDFTSSTACNGNRNPAIPRASYGRNPVACELLQCYWTGSTTTGTCGVRATRYTNSQNGCIFGPNNCVVSDCTWSTTQTECVNGRKTITYRGTASTGTGSPTICSGSPPNTCTRSPVTVPCGSLNFELSFFGKAQFIISVIAIAFLYFAFNFYRGKKHENKK